MRVPVKQRVFARKGMNPMACTYCRFEPSGFVNDGGSLTRFRHHAPHPSLGGLPRRQDRSPDAQIHFGRRRQNDPSKAGGSQKQTALMGRLAESLPVKLRGARRLTPLLIARSVNEPCSTF